jgi:hypothetical protein
MPISRPTERKAWLGLFNPCGLMVINGYGFKPCQCPTEQGIFCVPRDSYRMAGYVLDEGRFLNVEIDEYRKCLGGNRGKEIRMEDGTLATLGSNQSEAVKSVGVRAATILDEVDTCVQLGQPIAADYRTKLTADQVKILDRLYQQNLNAGQRSRYSLDGAIAAVDGMRSLLTEALDLDLGQFGLIARLSISYGLGERVPQATFSLIYKGQPTSQLVRME